MLQIREGCFETNSSSTHSLIMCSESQYKDWVDGKIYYCQWGEHFTGAKKGQFYTKEEALKIAQGCGDRYDEEDGLRSIGLYTFEDWSGDACIEKVTKYVTESGDTVLGLLVEEAF